MDVIWAEKNEKELCQKWQQYGKIWEQRKISFSNTFLNYTWKHCFEPWIRIQHSWWVEFSVKFMYSNQRLYFEKYNWIVLYSFIHLRHRNLLDFIKAWENLRHGLDRIFLNIWNCKHSQNDEIINKLILFNLKRLNFTKPLLINEQVVKNITRLIMNDYSRTKYLSTRLVEQNLSFSQAHTYFYLIWIEPNLGIADVHNSIDRRLKIFRVLERDELNIYLKNVRIIKLFLALESFVDAYVLKTNTL